MGDLRYTLRTLRRSPSFTFFGYVVSRKYFPLLGIHPSVGRLFNADDDDCGTADDVSDRPHFPYPNGDDRARAMRRPRPRAANLRRNPPFS